MNVVIVCANCNGISQVHEASLGATVQCPLCGAETVARAPEGLLPIAKPIQVSGAVANQEAPISLDDAFPLPPRLSEYALPDPEIENGRPGKRSAVWTAVYATTSLIFTLLLMGLIYKAFHYGSGDVPLSAWTTFKPPEGKCTIDLPGEPEVEEIPAGRSPILGGKRYVVKRWFERVQVTFGWIDLDADKTLDDNFDQVVLPVRDGEVKRLTGLVTSESSLNFLAGKRKFKARLYQLETNEGNGQLQVYFDSESSQLRFHDVDETFQRQIFVFAPLGSGTTGLWLPVEVSDTIQKRVIERGQRIRLWFASVTAKKFNADLKWVPKFFSSFAPE